MEPLLKLLRELPQKLQALPAAVRWGGAAVIIAALVGAGALLNTSGDKWQYAFTNLSTEDSTEVAATLKAAQIPFRVEAGGAALSVPAEKVYDVRLLLAAAGLPRGGGAGFELFDKGDLGVSEFTQKVNLRRALEGELARTIGHLAHVRSARVHLTLAEKGLYRDEEHKAAGAVVLQLQSGYSVGEREISGIRHLVASSVPGLEADAVTVVDGKGTVLSSQSTWGEAEAFRQREYEKSLEARLLSLLEPVVGAGAVIAKVSATLDPTEVNTSREQVDPQGVLRNEHLITQTSQQTAPGSGGVAGAAANQPLQPPAVAPGTTGANSSSANTQDQSRAYDVGRTVTRSVTRGFRVQRLSVALLVDGKDGNPRDDEELQQLAELSRKAVGFDVARGDQLEISSSVFTRSTEPEVPAEKPGFKIPGPPWVVPVGAALLGVLLALLLVRLLRRRPSEALVLKPGEKIGDLEAALAGEIKSEVPEAPSLPTDPNLHLRERARELAQLDPQKAALLLRAWITADEPEVKPNG